MKAAAVWDPSIMKPETPISPLLFFWSFYSLFFPHLFFNIFKTSFFLLIFSNKTVPSLYTLSSIFSVLCDLYWTSSSLWSVCNNCLTKLQSWIHLTVYKPGMSVSQGLQLNACNRFSSTMASLNKILIVLIKIINPEVDSRWLLQCFSYIISILRFIYLFIYFKFIFVVESICSTTLVTWI